MAYSTQRATSNGTLTLLGVSIAYVKQADISVFYNGVPAGGSTWAWVGTTPNISFTPAVPNGVEVLLKRTTQRDKVINTYGLGAAFNNATMDTNFRQALYIAQEAMEGAGLAEAFQNVDFHGYKPVNIGVAVADTDALQYGQYKTDINSTYANKVAAEAAAAAAAISAAAAAASAASINPALLVSKDADTGAANIPAGTTAQRGAGTLGRFRYNSTLAKWEGYGNTGWGNVGDAATDGVFYQNNQTITVNHTVLAGKNEFAAGPLAVADGITLLVQDGATFSVI